MNKNESHRHDRRSARTVRALLAAALLLAPVASRAETFSGGIKYTKACPGAGLQYRIDEFEIDIEPGASVGWVTLLGGGFEVLTDWMVDGRFGYFSASAQDGELGPVIFYGWIRNGRMKGWLAQHEYNTSCVLYGKIKAWN
jgi:hypothetical protein